MKLRVNKTLKDFLDRTKVQPIQDKEVDDFLLDEITAALRPMRDSKEWDNVTEIMKSMDLGYKVSRFLLMARLYGYTEKPKTVALYRLLHKKNINKETAKKIYYGSAYYTESKEWASPFDTDKDAEKIKELEKQGWSTEEKLY